MALHDENGKITIDEVAAQSDIRRIRTAKNSLNDSLSAISAIINQAANEKGETSTAIIEKAEEIKKQIADMISRLSETESFILKTVSHYQWVDQQIKRIITSSAGDEIGKGGKE